ncbi:hypothetical protein Tco_0836251 [Tanacetum coccineum]
MMLLNGSKSGNSDEHQPKLSNFFKNFDYNGGGRWWLKGGDGGEVLQAFSLENNPLKVSVGDDRGGDVGGSEVVAWWQRRCGSHDDGGVVEMRMCGGSVVGGGVGWRGCSGGVVGSLEYGRRRR